MLKVPHHGSADYLPEFLERVSPGVSVISSGDEGASDHIHPRATLLGALGRYSRPKLPRPVIFVTELAAFFRFVSRDRLVPARRLRDRALPHRRRAAARLHRVGGAGRARGVRVHGAPRTGRWPEADVTIVN